MLNLIQSSVEVGSWKLSGPSHLIGGRTVCRLVLFPILLASICLCGVGCARGSTPEPISEAITVRITNPDNQTMMVMGEETSFLIEIEPQSLKGLVADVNVFGDRGIQCTRSDVDMWTWYCVGSQEAEAATVFADVKGEFGEDQRASYSVRVVAPTPTVTLVRPTDAPTPVPIEPSVAGTPVPTESTKEPTPEATEEAVSTPPPQGECPFIPPIRIPIEGPPVDAEVRITSMENCADNLPAATPIPLAGTYSGDLTGREIWILVYPPDLKYYPQSTDACRELSVQFDSGRWAEVIRLGRPGISEVFHIAAVVTEVGSPASEAFHNYLTVGCSTGNYQGLTSIPPGATELDSIIVHTK